MGLGDDLRTHRVFGRDNEVGEIRRLIETSPGVVTIAGRGGVGKTTVAKEVVRGLDDADTSTWVSLAGVTDPDLVLPEIAHALDVPIEAGSGVAAVVADVLGHRRRVLVLDGAEHLLAFAPTLATLIDRCPDLRVLVTSQAPLRLQSERVVALASLPDPPDPAETTMDELAEQPAVAIYCRQAAAVDRHFELTNQNAAAIVELCRRLEGLPFAIELAAARAAMLPASAIVRLIDDSPLDVLRRPRADVPDRHHGLRSAIEWTYGLLSPDEQRALRALSVNVGTFDIDAALALIDRADDSGSDGARALDALSTLVDFHLVDPVSGSGPPRFSIPDSIREFALDELRGHGEAEDVERRRIVSRSRQARDVAEGTESCTTEGSVDADRDDMVDALRSAIHLGLAAEALDLARGLGSLWDLRGYGPAQEKLLERAIELGERSDADPSRLANATLWSAYLGLRHASSVDRDELIARIRKAEAAAEALGDDQVDFHAQNVWALVSPHTGDFEQAATAIAKGMAIAEAANHDGWRASIQVWAGMLAQLTGDEKRAVELGTAALDEARRRGDRETIVRAYMLLGPLADRFPDELAVLPSVEEMIELTRTLGMSFYEVLLMLRRVFNTVRSDPDVAVESMAEALERAPALLASPMIGFYLFVMVNLASARGDLDRAALFGGALDESMPILETYLTESQVAGFRHLLDRVRDQLGDAEYERHARHGAALAVGAVIDEATRYVDGLRQLATEAAPAAPPSASEQMAIERLTARQKEVLQLLAAGLSNKEIASRLGVRAKTVMHHTSAIYRELGVRGRSEATAVAFRAGLVD